MPEYADIRLDDQIMSLLDFYIETALWSSSDIDGDDTPMIENYSMDDFAPVTLLEMAEEIDLFYRIIKCDNFLDESLEVYEDEEIMHDFWLTRNGHGAGFWDGDYDDEVGFRLTNLSKRLGQRTLHVGDDGLIYQFKG